MKRPGLIRAILFTDLAALVVLLLLNLLPVLRMQRQYRTERAVMDEAVMEQSEQMNRVAFALARFFQVDSAAAGSGAAGSGGARETLPGDAWEEAARRLASHASIALPTELRAVDAALGDDPLVLRRRLDEADRRYSGATGRLLERHGELQAAGSAPQRLAHAEAFRREAAAFLPVVENRSRVLMQLEGTVESSLRSSRSLVLDNLRLLLVLQLAGAGSLALLIVVVLRAQTARVKTLRGLIPICASCKKVRNDRGYWNQVEQYVSEHSEANFSHGLCPDCLGRLYPDMAEELLEEAKKG